MTLILDNLVGTLSLWASVDTLSVELELVIWTEATRFGDSLVALDSWIAVLQIALGFATAPNLARGTLVKLELISPPTNGVIFGECKFTGFNEVFIDIF